MIQNLTLKFETSSIPVFSPPFPHSLELTVLFREFVHYWTGLATAIPESKTRQTLVDPVEYAARWTGSIKGTLVLRASPGFPEKLAQVFEEKGVNTGGNSLLQEMTALYSIFLVHYTWVDELFELGPILARPSNSSLWPSSEPHSFCAVEVEGEPVEIRLWIGDSKDKGKQG